MAADNWAHVQLGVSIHPSHRGDRVLCVDWRLSAKAPSEQWTTRSTVAHGSERVQGVAWPLSRDDALACMVEVLMGVRWTPDS